MIISDNIVIPDITQQPADLTITLLNNYTNASLTCEANGALSFKWEKQNDVIPSDSTGVNTNTLTLINLQPEDAGNYRCVATNAGVCSESNYATITISCKCMRSYVPSYILNLINRIMKIVSH